jgi:hypothetical protein
MPSIFEQNAVYLQSGDPTKEDVAVLMEPGLLGARFTMQHPTGRGTPGVPPRTKRFQVVKSDPAMATNVALGSPAYWLDKSQPSSPPTPPRSTSWRACSRDPDQGQLRLHQISGRPRQALGCQRHRGASGDNVIGGAVGLGVRVASGTALTNQSLGRVAVPLVKDVPNATVVVDIDVPEAV